MAVCPRAVAGTVIAAFRVTQCLAASAADSGFCGVLRVVGWLEQHFRDVQVGLFADVCGWHSAMRLHSTGVSHSVHCVSGIIG